MLGLIALPEIPLDLFIDGLELIPPTCACLQLGHFLFVLMHVQCCPTVFRLQWPPDITANVISEANPKGTITNSDLELAGLILLWLMMEHI